MYDSYSIFDTENSSKSFLVRKMNENDAENIKPNTRKVLVIEWPDQRSVFEKNKGNVLILEFPLTGSTCRI